MDPDTAQALIERYGLQPHPEGGYYRETYRSAAKIHPPGYSGERHFSTGIYFLLPQGAVSRFHRIKSDEMWHFYLGGPLTLVQIDAQGGIATVVLGSDWQAGHQLQHVVPAGHWFGGFPNPDSTYSLVGCTVSPGFDFADFEMGQREALLRRFPHAQDYIRKLTESAPLGD